MASVAHPVSPRALSIANNCVAYPDLSLPVANLSCRIPDHPRKDVMEGQVFDSVRQASDLSPPIISNDIGATLREIAQLGFDPPSRYGREQTAICGTSLRLSVQNILANTALADEFLDTLSKFANVGVPVCLFAEDFPPGKSTIESWRLCCERIRDEFLSRRLDTTKISCCIHSHRMPLEAYCLITDSLLGFGPRYVFLDSMQMANHCNPRVTERANCNWIFLWRQRLASRPVIPIYGGLVRSACRLLTDEVATAVIPSNSLHAPLGSAWVSIGLPLMRFLRPIGQLDWSRLRDALRQMMLLADYLFDQATWCDSRQLRDVRENRRLAIRISGLGDLLRSHDLSPAAFDSLKRISSIVRRIRGELANHSAQLAADFSMLPALTEAESLPEWTDAAKRERWQRQWEIAVRKSAVRHRNLLVMSPASILPAATAGSASFADLLPVLGMADAWSFESSVSTPGWTVAEFRDFHRRARATIQGAQQTSFVADQV